MALFKHYGVKDSLSVQYFNTAYRPQVDGDPADPVYRGSAATVVRTYKSLGRLVPSSNPGAHYQDRELSAPKGQEPEAGAERLRLVRSLGLKVVESPCYHLSALELEPVQTSGTGADPIKAIKRHLASGQVVLFDDSKQCTAIVGYDTRGPVWEHCWIILESRGRRGRQGDGTVRRLMDSIDYADNKANRFEVISRFEQDGELYPEMQTVSVRLSPSHPTQGQPVRLISWTDAMPPVRYQWFLDSVPLAGPAGTASTYEVAPDQAGYFHVETTSHLGIRESSAMVWIGPEPAV